MSQLHDEWLHRLPQIEQLTEAERVALAQHLQSCALCREQLAHYRFVDESLRRYFSVTVLPADPPALPVLKQPQRPTAPHPAHTTLARPEGRVFDPAVGRWRRLDPLSSIRAVAIVLGAGLFTLALGWYVLQVPGINLALVTPLANIAIAAVILIISTRRTLVFRQEWSRVPSHSPYSRLERQHFTTSGSSNYSETPATYKHAASELLPVQKNPPERSWRDRGRWLLVALILFAVGLASLSITLFTPPATAPRQTTVAMQRGDSALNTIIAGLSPTGISITGDRVFDVNRKDVEFKRTAAQAIARGDSQAAQNAWREALSSDSDDAEVLIYQENLRVHDDVNKLPGRYSYMTYVVYTTLYQEHIGGGRDILQGAYVAQHEYNERVRTEGGKLLRIMIAVTNRDDASIKAVTKQIIEAAHHDSSLVGVMGLPTSKIAQLAYPLLAQAHLPMVSPTSSSISLTGVSDYFFRIAPPDDQQAKAGAEYAKTHLQAHTVALFVDDADPYSKSLADSFEQHFGDLQHTVVRMPYQQGHPETIEKSFKQAQQLLQKPDLIYFAGFVNDASVVLKLLPACAERGPCLKVMGGDGLYVQGDYSLEAYKSYARLIFTAFAFPDAWKVQGREEKPAFFDLYTQAFDPTGQYQPGKYGFNRADADAILSYDAMQALLHASSQVLDQQQALTPETEQQALKGLDAQHAFQGISRRIAFDKDGNPVDRQVVILVGNVNNQTILAGVQ